MKKDSAESNSCQDRLSSSDKIPKNRHNHLKDIPDRNVPFMFLKVPSLRDNLIQGRIHQSFNLVPLIKLMAGIGKLDRMHIT